MHHYSTVTSLTFVDRPSWREIWQDEVPREALKHPFLMHGLLSVTALHIAHLNQNGSSRKDAYIRAAAKHQDQALSSSRQVLGNISPQNCNALIAFACFVAVFAFASPRPTSMNFHHFAEVMTLLRGISAICNTARVWIDAGAFAPIVNFDLNHNPDILDLETASALDRLDVQAQRMSRTGEEAAVYADSIAKLRLVLSMGEENSQDSEYHSLSARSQSCDGESARSRNMSASSTCTDSITSAHIVATSPGFGSSHSHTPVSPPAVSLPNSHNPKSQCNQVPLIWPHIVPSTYIALLKSSDPMALAILAHHSLLDKSIEQHWWSRGSGVELAIGIRDAIGHLEGWSGVIGWVMRESGLDSAARRRDDR